MKVISVANKKGGVGKTSLAVNIAYELSKMKKVVLMIDLDPQCDLSKVYVQQTIEKDVMGVLRGYYSIEEAIEEVEENLYILAGSEDLNHYKENKETSVLKEKLQAEELTKVDFVIIDNPSDMNEGALEGFKASDEVLIVTDPETFSIDNLDKFLEDLKAIKLEMNTKLHILGVAINRADLRRNLTKNKIKELESIFKEDLLGTYIGNDTAIPISLDKKIPIRKLHYRSRTVSQFNQLTKEILERMEIQ